MGINETLNFFENLKNENAGKSEIKVYNKYIEILSDLQNRDLTATQILSIEAQLQTLNLKAETNDRKKYFDKQLSQFKKFLKDNLSLISEGHYTGCGMLFGMLVGILCQFYFGLYSMLIGMLIGMMVGLFMDSEARKQGRILNKKSNK
jgi:F0F1-type ATP synthase assembly protein I